MRENALAKRRSIVHPSDVTKMADPWRFDHGRWVRMCGPLVVAQVTENMWYLLRDGGSGGMTGSALDVESGRRTVDRRLLRDGWELTF